MIQKSAHYRTAAWFQPNGPLSRVMTDMFNNFQDGVTPVFRFEDMDAVVANRQSGDGEFLLNIVLVERGASAAVIEWVRDRDALDAEEASAPDGTEFVQTQLFLMIRGDDVVWVIHNQTIRERKVLSVLHGLIESQIGAEGNVDFELQAALDQETVRDLFRSGIERIDLGVGDFRSELERLDSGGRLPNARLMSFLESYQSDEDLEAASQVRANLSIIPGRSWGRDSVKAFLSDVALKGLDEYGDEIAIQTKSGVRITRDKLTVKKIFKVEGTKQVLPAFQVFNGMRSVYALLQEQGVVT